MNKYREQIGKIGIFGNEDFVNLVNSILKDYLGTYSLDSMKPSFSKTFGNHFAWLYVMEERAVEDSG